MFNMHEEWNLENLKVFAKFNLKSVIPEPCSGSYKKRCLKGLSFDFGLFFQLS